MSKWQEDLIYEIAISVKELGLEKKFDKQMTRMRDQTKHRYKTMSERYEYAYNKVTKKSQTDD